MLVGLGILALAIVLVVYPQLFSSRQGTGVNRQVDDEMIREELEARESEDIFNELADDLEGVQNTYNFEEEPAIQDLTAPDFTSELSGEEEL